jgi:virginiamycin B lyase
MALLAASIVVPAGRGFATAGVTRFTDPSFGHPTAIAAGPDGALWFTDGQSIRRITTGGAVTSFTDPSIGFLVDITAGPDGALWFTEQDSVGRITTGGVITFFTDPSVDRPGRITAGPDGALWFANSNSSIGRITTGGAVTNFPGPGIGSPLSITAGPDGALWFTKLDNSIGRMTTGGVVTTFTDSRLAFPLAITPGPDGALWFVNGVGGLVGRITTGGAISYLARSPRLMRPSGQVDLVLGPDGALWLTDLGGTAQVGRMSFSGAYARVSGPDLSNPQQLAVGSDGALWVANPYPGGPSTAGWIARVDVTAALHIATTSLPPATVGVPYSASLTAGAGSPPPYLWKKVAHSRLPSGLRFDKRTGVISGTPKRAGSHVVSIEVRDSAKPRNIARRNFPLVVH